MSNEDNQTTVNPQVTDAVEQTDAQDEQVTENTGDSQDNGQVEQAGSEDLAALKTALEAAEAKAQESVDVALRAKAELENVKRRSVREIENANKFALERFCNELLPVVDSLEKGLEVNVESEEGKAVKEGLELTSRMLLSALEKSGISQLSPEKELFNPEFHEAMVMQETTEVEPDHVLAVIQKGYMLNGRLIRPARVIVAKPQTPAIDEKA